MFELLARRRFLQVLKKGVAFEHCRLDHLGAAVVENGVGERGQSVRVAEDQRRLAECADEIFARRKIDRRLAADRGVDLRQKRRRNLYEPDPAQVGRRGKASHISDHAAAERNNKTLA